MCYAELRWSNPPKANGRLRLHSYPQPLLCFVKTLPDLPTQNADLTSGVVNNQPIHLVDLFQSIIGAALDGAKYSFKNEVSGAFS